MKTHRFLWLGALYLAALFALTACGSGGTTTTPKMTGKLIGTPYTERTSEVQVQNNCDGSTLKMTISRGITKEQNIRLEMQGGIKTGVPAVFEADIRTTVDQVTGNVIVNGISLDLATESGHKLEHTIVWEETLVAGIVDVLIPDSPVAVDFRKVIGLKLINRTSRELPCSGEVSAPGPTIAQPALPLKPTFAPPSVIPAPQATQAPEPAASATNSNSPLIIDGVSYPWPDWSTPYCVAQEINTGMNTIKSYAVTVPDKWVMMWNAWKAEWPGGSFNQDGLLIIRGPWHGTIKINTGGSCSGPMEWYAFILRDRTKAYPVPYRPKYIIP